MLVVGDIEDWGYLPNYLDEADPRKASEQFNERYLGGWLHTPGCGFDPDRMVLTYPGDPPQRAISILFFRNELLVLFPHSFVVIVQPDASWEIARLD